MVNDEQLDNEGNSYSKFADLLHEDPELALTEFDGQIVKYS